MTDLYQRIVAQRSSFENLMAKVPGYRGYKEATDRRADDRMIREHVVALLKQQFMRLVDVEKKILPAGGLAQASVTREAKSSLKNFIDRVNTAMPGYSGFYDAQKVGPEQLEKIYSFDAALLSYADKVRDAITALDAAAADKAALPGAVTQLEAVGTEANAAYALRENVLTEIA